jgi:hypothetical protein
MRATGSVRGRIFFFEADYVLWGQGVEGAS